MSAACGDGAGAGRGWGRALAGALTAAPAAALHAEPYVLFSTDKKSLLCIRCFRDMQGWVEGAGGEGLASVPERGSRAGSGYVLNSYWSIFLFWPFNRILIKKCNCT